ncbi:HTH La-type RNA-binding domain-containing protein [Penicillium ucsense]|uniref:HTH La-type RNA-binding domain-containing protein n=1 Tax=Penicillium ucsense TaxID=2839758 RepID=A0A8J8WN71_9EURO|nr:HTH La-type RNA-binding domain-containing protein [Penicillium ucsense]KAF7735703.1 HTH La-type RNA-binding domain-containing protein [Penicillium ucsense]
MSATFSYAQAAKGAAANPVSSKPASTEPEKAEQKVEEQTESSAAQTESVTTASETETPQEMETSTTSVDNDAEFTTVTSKHVQRSKANNSRTASPSVRSNATQSKDTDSSNTTNGSATPSEKQAQSEAKAGRSDSSSEKSKDKAEKSDKSEKFDKAEKSGKSEKPAPPKELKAAPLPSVNIWQQRKEAQEAKAKTVPVVPMVKPKSEESTQDPAKASTKKKAADSTVDGNKGKKSDGKGRDEGIPPVADASSWPTPQTALGEDKKKAQEKGDKPERTDKSPVPRSHGKEKWMPVNYVPTAVFNTPLPTTSGRGGRRTTRGGRDGGRGGPHGSSAASTEKTGSGQPGATAAGKQGPGERGRHDNGGARAASLPAQGRRSASADVSNQDARKAQHVDRGRAPRDSENSAVNGKALNGGEQAPRPMRDGKLFFKNQEGRAGDRGSKGAHLAVDAQVTARATERRVESGSKSADPSRDTAGFHDFNRERGDNRADRGGRHPNRAPRPFTNYNQHNQFGMGNTFVPGKFGFNDRQRSQQHAVQNNPQQSNRMPMRSPSLPASGGMYNPVYTYPAEINTMYPSYSNVAPGPMSAVPYQQYMEPFAFMNMLSMQLEYYFSVDNMCKDMFLRRHMDSQGFVPLAVVAGFKRMRTLTEDFEMLRHVSRGLRNVEYQMGEDGVDRLRPREKWAQWVLPVEQREPCAQHEGAPMAQVTAKHDEQNAASNLADGTSNGSMHPGSRPFVPNGTANGVPESRTFLSSAAVEFQPSQNEISNRAD